MVNVGKGLVAVGKSLIPGFAQLEAFVGATYGDADEDWQTAATKEYRDWVVTLEARMQALEDQLRRGGRTIDDAGPLRTRALRDEWIRDISEAKTDEKRDAVTNATVRRFDPTWRSASAREYWLKAVRELDDIEIEFLNFMDGWEVCAYDAVNDVFHRLQKGHNETEQSSGDTAAAMGEALGIARVSGVAIESPEIQLTDDGGAHLESWILSGKGRALLRAIQRPA